MKNQKLFDKYKKHTHWYNHPGVYADWFLRFLIVKGVDVDKEFDGQIVDLGCGNGRDVAFFHQAGCKSLGIDNDEKEIAFAHKLNPECKFIVGDIENLPWQDESIDAFFMINVIHYLDERRALAEIFRALKKGGYLYLHINLSITDKKGNVDYQGYDLQKTIKSIPKARILSWQYFKRIDLEPEWHEHKILEIILQKV